MTTIDTAETIYLIAEGIRRGEYGSKTAWFFLGPVPAGWSDADVASACGIPPGRFEGDYGYCGAPIVKRGRFHTLVTRFGMPDV